MTHFDFGPRARSYDSYYDDPVGRMVDRMEKAAVARLLPDAEPGQTLLESGSGTGHWSEWFAGKGYNVTGVDVAEEMVEVAEEKRQEKGIENVRYYVGDASDLQFPSDHFDVGAVITVLEFASDPEKVISELARVVRKNGRLIVCVLQSDSYLDRKQRRGEYLSFSEIHFFSEPELENLLRPYGDVTITRCLFAPPVAEAVDMADRIESMGLERNWRIGNFLVAEVLL